MLCVGKCGWVCRCICCAETWYKEWKLFLFLFDAILFYKNEHAVVVTLHRRTFRSLHQTYYKNTFGVPFRVCSVHIHSAVHHFVCTKVLCSYRSSYLQGIQYTIFVDEKNSQFFFRILVHLTTIIKTDTYLNKKFI